MREGNINQYRGILVICLHILLKHLNDLNDDVLLILYQM